MPITVQQGDSGTVLRLHVREIDPANPGSKQPVDLTDLDSAQIVLRFMDGSIETLDADVEGDPEDGIISVDLADYLTIVGNVRVRAILTFPDWVGRSSRVTFNVELVDDD